MIKRESLRKGSITTSLLNVVGKGIGFFSVFLVSFLFGANSDTDIFYFLLSFTLLITTLFSNLYSSVFLPLFIKIKEQDGQSEAWKFLNSLFTYTLIFSVAISCIYYSWAIKIISHFSYFSPETLLLSKEILVSFAPVISLMILVEFLKTIIQSQHQFSLPALSVLFNSIINIFLLLILGKWLGVKVMVVSVIVSYVFQFIFLYIYIRKHERHFAISLKWSKYHREFFILSTPVIITQLFSVASMFYYDYSATLFSAGTLTAIALAQKVFSLPQEMLISPVSNIVAPVFSENSATCNYKKFIENFIRYNNLIWFVIIPLSFFLIFYSDGIIQFLFTRGAFTNEDAHVSSVTLQLLSFALFGYSFHAIATRAFFAMQKTVLLSLISFSISLISIGITYAAVKKIGYPGIALSRTVSVIFLSVSSSLVLLRHYLPEFKLCRIVVPFFKMSIGALVASMVSCYIFTLVYDLNIFESPFSRLILAFCTSVPIFLMIYSCLCFLLKVAEFLEIFSLFKNKLSFINLKFLKT